MNLDEVELKIKEAIQSQQPVALNPKDFENFVKAELGDVAVKTSFFLLATIST
jgi:hypothetical protein